MGLSLVALASACAPFGLRSRAPDPPPVVVVDTTPVRPAWPAPAPAATVRSDEDGLLRLVRLAETWHAVRWFHPDVVDRAGAWDTAYLRHVDRARAARTDAAFAQAVQAMLGELFDAGTRVVVDTMPRPVEGAARAALVTTDDGLVLARPVALAGGDLSSLAAGAPRTATVLDLRADSGRVAGLTWRARAPRAEELPLPDGSVMLPVRRHVRRAGPDVPDPRAAIGGAPAFSWVVRGAPALTLGGAADSLGARERPPAARDGYQPPRVVVLVNDGTVVPAALLALHARGEVAFVSTGGGALHDDARVAHVALGGGFFARVRLEELLSEAGRPVAGGADTTLVADAPSALAPDTTDTAVALALAVARGTVRLTPRGPAPARLAVAPPTPPAADRAGDVPYPSHPERLLAVTQLWGAVRAFNPYLPMADETWDDAFASALGEVEAAASARAYATALLRLAGTLDASQVTVTVPDHPETWRRAGAVPFTLRLVSGTPVVAAIDDTAAVRSGVRVGDEIVAIGGEPIDKRFERLRPLVSASNAWSREAQLRAWLEEGPALVKATFRVRGATERGTPAPPRDVEFQYGEAGLRARPAPRRQVDSLPGGVVRVTLGTADTPLPAWVAGAAGVIVDARGIRDGLSLAWLAGSALDADAMAYARDERSTLEAPPTAPLRAPELDAARATTRTVRTSPRAPREAFTGPMAILVDAGTLGEGELIVLRLRAGGMSRVLVGAPTAGAVGDVTTLRLPGQVQVTIPVREVRHPDGGFVQRLGLTPSITVTPTVTAVRNGRDEALEAAQRWLAQQLAPPSVRRR